MLVGVWRLCLFLSAVCTPRAMDRQLRARIGAARVLLQTLLGQSSHAAVSRVQADAAIAAIASADLNAEVMLMMILLSVYTLNSMVATAPDVACTNWSVLAYTVDCTSVLVMCVRRMCTGCCAEATPQLYLLASQWQDPPRGRTIPSARLFSATNQPELS